MADEIKNPSTPPSSDITQGLISQLINSMSTSQKDLTTEIRNLIKNIQQGSSQKGSENPMKELQSSLRSLEKDIESLDRDISKTHKESRRVEGKTYSTPREERQVIAERELLDIKISNQRAMLDIKNSMLKALQDVQKSLSDAKTDEERISILKAFEQKQAKSEKEFRALEQKSLELESLITSVRQSAQAFDTWTKATEESTKTVDSFSGRIEDVGKSEQELFNKQKDAILKSLNADLDSAEEKAAATKEEIEQLEDLGDVSQEAVDKKREELESIERFIKSQKQAIKTVNDLTLEDQKRIKKEQENAKMWQDTKSGVLKTLKEIPGQMITGITKWGIFDRLESTLQSGFDKIYQSVETTRNQISARSRLDQGAFTQLQNEIQDQIEAQGLTGIINQADVNDAITNLSAAGITDKELLKNLALEQAKANAMGSSLDLTNEGTIQAILGQLSAGTSWTDIQGIIEATRAEELALREQYGQSYALERGGLTRIFEEGLSKATAYGLSAQDYITSSAAAQQSAGSIGLDPTIFTKTLDAIENRTISEQSTFGQILAQGGLTASSIATMGQEEQYRRMQEVYVQYLKDANESTIQYIQQVLGFDATNRELFTMARTIKEQGSLNLAQGVDYSANEKLLKDYESQAKSGAFISKTEYETNKQLDTISEVAIGMEKFYKGDQLYHSVTDPVLNGLTSAANSIINAIVASALSGHIGSSVGGGGGSSVASLFKKSGVSNAASTALRTSGKKGIVNNGTPITMEPEMEIPDFGSSGMPLGTRQDFLFGTSGTKAGIAGKALGAAAGAVQLGTTMYGHKDAATLEDFATDTLSDTNAIAGIMTTAGSLVAGPIGGAVGQASAQIGGALNTLLPESVKDGIGAAVTHLLPITSTAAFRRDLETKSFKEFDEMAKQLNSAADALMESASAQMESATSQLDTFSSFDSDQQKMYLLQNGLMSAQDLLNKSDAEINDVFKQLVMEQLENERKKAETEARRAQAMKESASSIATFKSNFKQIKKASTNIGASGTSQQEDLITANLGGAASAAAIAEYVLSSDSIDKGIDELFKDADLSGKEKDALSRYFENIKGRKIQYEQENKKFQDKWNQAKAEAKSDNFTDIFIQYASKFDVEPRIKYDDNGQPILVDGLPVLYDSQGQYKVNQFSEAAGNFRTGLTRVPYDNYPAFLHEGERILTKEEAKSYNSLVSYMVENATTNSNSSSEVEQIFTDSIINGNTDVKESITEQTETLSAKMDSLITLVEELMRALSTSRTYGKGLGDVLKMNSNVMQLNTTI